MKYALPLLSLAFASCSENNYESPVATALNVEVNNGLVRSSNYNHPNNESYQVKVQLPTSQNNIKTLKNENRTPAPCHVVTDYVQSFDIEQWQETIRKIRIAYANVIKVLNDKETIDFTVTFFHSLSVSEDLDEQSQNLYEQNQSYLPNADSLKFLFKAEKEINALLPSLTNFTTCSNEKIKRCATEAVNFLSSQRDFFVALREIDFRKLPLDRISQDIPPETVLAYAKLLEQRERMSEHLVIFYEGFVKTN